MAKLTEQQIEQIHQEIDNLVGGFYELFDFNDREQAQQALQLYRERFEDEFGDEVVDVYFRLSE